MTGLPVDLSEAAMKGGEVASRWANRVTALLVALAVVGACSTPPLSPEPPVDLKVVPQQIQGFAIAGQQVVFLVGLAGDGGSPVTITATATNAESRVEGPAVGPGEDVAEVVVVPSAAAVGTTVTVTIEGRRATVADQASVSFEVIEGSDDRRAQATKLLDRFVRWIAVNHPDLGITHATEWVPTMVSPQWLVVSHYLFFSDEWEAHVSWHVMIAPHDWGHLDLRRRFVGVTPSMAFEIPSLSSRQEPRSSEVPESVWR